MRAGCSRSNYTGIAGRDLIGGYRAGRDAKAKGAPAIRANRKRAGLLELETILQRELHDARIVRCLRQSSQTRDARCSGLAERWQEPCSQPARRVQIHVIRKIEDLPPKFHLLVLANREEPRQPRIDDDRPRPEQAIVTQIAEGRC
jgi:hypothetical protein